MQSLLCKARIRQSIYNEIFIVAWEWIIYKQYEADKKTAFEVTCQVCEPPKP